MGAGGVWEAGEEGAGDRIPKGVRVGRNRKCISQHCIMFCNRKSKHTEAGTTKGGGGNRVCKVQEAENSDPPASPFYGTRRRLK